MEHELILDGGLGGSHLRGRPAQVFKVNAAKGVLLVADVAVGSIRLAVARLDKSVIERGELDISVDLGPETVLSEICASFEAMLKQHGLSKRDCMAVSVGLPGPVDSRMGYAVRPPLMPGWDGFGVCKYMAEQFVCDVIVDNNVNLMALAEARSYGESYLPLLLVHIGKGVGAGFVSEDGLLLHGADGAATDIGHMQARELADVLCNCGNRGCLEAVASVDAMAARVAAVAGAPVDADDLIARLIRGEAATVNIVREVAGMLGRATADMVNFCNPARLVIGGEVTECTEDMLAQIRSVVYQQAQPLATRNLSIVHGSLGAEAGLIGGMISGIEQVLSPRGIQYLTRPADSTMQPLGMKPGT